MRALLTAATATFVLLTAVSDAVGSNVPVNRDKPRDGFTSRSTPRVVLSRLFGTVPQTDDFASGNQITAAGGTAEVNLDPAQAYDNTYTVHYYVQVTLSAPGMDPYVALTVKLETNDGSGWVERASFLYERFTAGTSTWSHEQKSIVVSGLDPNDDIRLRAHSFVKFSANGSFVIRGGDAGGANPETYNGVTYATSADPVVDLTPYNYATQDYSRCAVACFAAVHQQSTTPYFSLDVPRAVTLVYNSDRVNPRPFVHVNVSPAIAVTETPTEYRLEVKVNGAFVNFLNGEQTLRFSYPGAITARIGGQFDAASYATGVYPMNILVSAVYPIAGVSTKDIATKLVVVNETNSAIAAGWTLAGIQRLYLQGDSSALITEGDGSAVYFLRTGGAYVSPTGDFSQLATGMAGGGTGWTRSYADSTKVVFDNMGREAEVRDRFNNISPIVYETGTYRVSQVKDELNNAITLTYDGNGLTSIQDAASRLTDVAVDASKSLITITDPDNFGTTFGYDASLRLRAITNRAGQTDSLNYLVISGKQTNKLASVKRPAVPIFGGGSSSAVTTVEPWQIKGVPYDLTNAPSGTPLNPPRADTVYARLVEPLGAAYVTRFTANQWGTPLQSTDPIGQVTTITYYSTGLPWTVQRPWYGSLRDTLQFNGSGLLTYQRPAGDSATTITYGGWAQPTSVATAGQPTVSYTLGSFGLVSSVSWGGVTRASYLYDGYGRVKKVTDARNTALHRLAYPTSGAFRNLSADTLPGNRVIAYAYDSYGRRTTVTPPGAAQQVTHYNAVNWIDSVRTLTPTVPRVKYAYDRMGRDTAITDPKDQTYKFTYNALGWLIRKIDPVGARDTFQYNLGGELLRSTNRLGQNLDYAYDLLHRDTSRVGSVTAKWSYTPNSLIVTATQTGVASVTTYPNILGAPDSVKTILNGYSYWQRFRYVAAGVDSMYFTGSQDAAHLTVRRYRYNATTGVLDSIALGTQKTALLYDNNLIPITEDYPGTTVTNRTIGSLQATLTSTTEGTNNSSLERWLGFTTLGQIDRHLRYSGKDGRWFAYDSLGQLRLGRTRLQTPEGSLPPNCPDFDYGMSGTCTPNVDYVTLDSAGYTYDAAGNRTDLGGSYTTGNRLTAFAGCTYKTDAAGNIVSRKGSSPCVQIDTLLWTVEGWLDSLKLGSTGVKFLYDADGRLVAKRVNGAIVSWFLWVGGNLLAELGGSAASVATEYSYYGADAPHAVIKQPSGQRLYARMDGLGNVLALTDTGGSIQSLYNYGDWGASGQPLDGNRARWKGALWMGPEVDVYYMRNRWYEPATGRFLSEDPMGLAAGINPVLFESNDPVNGSDPSGLGDLLVCRRQPVWGPTWGGGGIDGFTVISTIIGYATRCGWVNGSGGGGSGGGGAFGGPTGSAGGGGGRSASRSASSVTTFCHDELGCTIVSSEKFAKCQALSVDFYNYNWIVDPTAPPGTWYQGVYHVELDQVGRPQWRDLGREGMTKLGRYKGTITITVPPGITRTFEGAGFIYCESNSGVIEHTAEVGP